MSKDVSVLFCLILSLLSALKVFLPGAAELARDEIGKLLINGAECRELVRIIGSDTALENRLTEMTAVFACSDSKYDECVKA